MQNPTSTEASSVEDPAQAPSSISKVRFTKDDADSLNFKERRYREEAALEKLISTSTMTLPGILPRPGSRDLVELPLTAVPGTEDWPEPERSRAPALEEPLPNSVPASRRSAPGVLRASAEVLSIEDGSGKKKCYKFTRGLSSFFRGSE